MKMKSVIAAGLAMMAATIIAGEKIAPDLNKLTPEWQLTSAKVMEEGGQKYFHIEDIGGDIARVAYPSTPLNGAKQVKVTLKYRTDVSMSRPSAGIWYYIGFWDGNNPVKVNGEYCGVFFELKNEWTALEKILDVPEGAKEFEAQLRVQMNTPKGKSTGKFLDAKDIVIELIK